MAISPCAAVSCELGLIETTGPTGGTQHREYWGGPTMARQPPVVVVPGGEFAGFSATGPGQD